MLTVHVSPNMNRHKTVTTLYIGYVSPTLLSGFYAGLINNYSDLLSRPVAVGNNTAMRWLRDTLENLLRGFLLTLLF